MESGFYEARNLPIPQWYLDEPHIDRTDNWYLTAFWELSSERRAYGFTLGPIPWSKLLAYVERATDEPALQEYLQTVVKELDGLYLRHLAEKVKKRTAEPEDRIDGSTPRPRRGRK